MYGKWLVGLCLWLVVASGVQAAEVYLRAGLGLSDYKARGEYLGNRGEPGFDDLDYSGVAGVGVRFWQRVSLEVSNLELEFLPLITDHLYGVDGCATRWLAGYQHPLNDWAHLGVQAGVMDWKVDVKPAILRGSRSFSGRDTYYGLLLRLGNERAAFLVGHDRSQFESINYKLNWVGFELAFGR